MDNENQPVWSALEGTLQATGSSHSLVKESYAHYNGIELGKIRMASSLPMLDIPFYGSLQNGCLPTKVVHKILLSGGGGGQRTSHCKTCHDCTIHLDYIC